MNVTSEGGRVLGCLVEKALTTPQQYPLTLNALTSACSQSTNRDPVMTMDETAVERALQDLKGLHLVRFVLPSHGRSVTRFRHVMDEAYGLDRSRVALLAVLLLRGPQTRVSDSASGVGMRTVRDIRIPADQTLRLAPNGFHLEEVIRQREHRRSDVFGGRGGRQQGRGQLSRIAR